MIGWIYEVFLEVVVYRWGFSNSGVLFGPYCVIYGIGALLSIFSLGKLQKERIYIEKLLITPLLVFFGIILITTAVELLGSYIMEFATGGWMWDHRKYAFDLQGRIALNPSIRFGIGGDVFSIRAAASVHKTGGKNACQDILVHNRYPGCALFCRHDRDLHPPCIALIAETRAFIRTSFENLLTNPPAFLILL